jgi:hypothetical protein
MVDRADFQEIFECRRGVLPPFAGQRVVQADTSEDYSFSAPYLRGFEAVRRQSGLSLPAALPH